MIVPISSPGVLPAAPSVALGVGTYSWKIDFNLGGTFQELNLSSSTGCGISGQPNVTVGSPLAVTVTASLTGGGQSGTIISVAIGIAVTILGSLSGPHAASATGWVECIYTSKASNCSGSSLSDEMIAANGVLPASPAIVASSPGTYYWGIRYSDDAFNAGFHSGCIAVETVGNPVLMPPAPKPTPGAALHQKRWRP